jgi:hypothetical protein
MTGGKFSTSSKRHLASAHPKLQKIFNRVVTLWDCTIIIGHRGEAAQNLAFATGASTKRWPEGEHNGIPSRAVDAAPYPIAWANREQFLYWGGFVMGVATEMGIKLRYGGDWDGDGNPRNQTLNDYVHFELAKEEV